MRDCAEKVIVEAPCRIYAVHSSMRLIISVWHCWVSYITDSGQKGFTCTD